MSTEAPTTRCKFRVEYVKNYSHGAEVELTAVSPDETLDGFKHSEEHAFWNATPTGKLTMFIQNPHGAEILQPGEFYYLDITLAPNPYKQPGFAS